MGGPNINWINPRGASSKIFLCIIDDTISDELVNLYLKYCQAFYSGIPVQVIKPGSKIEEIERNGKVTVKHTFPANFLEAHNITRRENCGTQLHAGEILQALKLYKVRDTFCTLAITNTDLYPRDEWNFVFGLAMPGH